MLSAWGETKGKQNPEGELEGKNNLEILVVDGTMLKLMSTQEGTSGCHVGQLVCQ
jgi:hypothetical protein